MSIFQLWNVVPCGGENLRNHPETDIIRAHQARNILLRVAAIRERRGRELIRIGSKGTSKEKQKALDEVTGGPAGTLST